MCTPVDLEAMAVGFLFNEGVIASRQELADVRLCAAGDNVDVWLHHSAEKPDRWRRTSGCTGGITSVEMEDDPKIEQPLPAYLMHPGRVGQLMEMLLHSQSLYRASGGVHTSAISDGEQLLIVTEDIGRHNTLDKIAGRLLLEDGEAIPRILLTTGRISSEMLQKSWRIGVTIVISRTSPSSLSIRLAERRGMTLIGYARRDRFILYSHPERIHNFAAFEFPAPLEIPKNGKQKLSDTAENAS
jgi:FdhD protein